MTSQKRYRIHECTNFNRSREIPPRFKRQKSSSSPKPLADTQENLRVQSPSSPDTQENPRVQSPSKELISPSVASSPDMAPLPSNNDGPTYTNSKKEFYYNRRLPSSPFVRSHSGNPRMDMPVPVWIDPRTGAVLNTPLYTWDSPWHMPSQNRGVFGYQSPLMPRDNNIPHSLTMAEMKSEESLLGLQDMVSRSPASPPVAEKVDGPHSTPDYSDPDIRTIEMLRELERVADEKEKEDENDPTSDRRNLVSHHLRMLMCAVDKYTEGVDDGYESLSETLVSDGSNDKSILEQTSLDSTLGEESASPTRATMMNETFSDAIVGQVSPHYIQKARESENGDDGSWHTMISYRSRSHRGGNRSRNYRATNLNPPDFIAPKVVAPVKTPPPSHSAPISPVLPAMSPRHCRTPSPYKHQQAYPMRAITKFASDQDQVPQPQPRAHQNVSVVNNRSSPCVINSSRSSPALSPPLNSKNVWGCLREDGPTSAKSWDIWSGPSFTVDVLKPQNDVVESFPFTDSLYPIVPCPPIDRKGQIPLYKRSAL